MLFITRAYALLICGHASATLISLLEQHADAAQDARAARAIRHQRCFTRHKTLSFTTFTEHVTSLRCCLIIIYCLAIIAAAAAYAMMHATLPRKARVDYMPRCRGAR